MPSRPRAAAPVIAVVAALVLPAVAVRAADPLQPGAAERPVSIRIRWGGGAARAWSGRIAVLDAGAAAGAAPAAGTAPLPIPQLPFSWKTLCTSAIDLRFWCNVRNSRFKFFAQA
jgi:hypothetical protein